MKTSLGIIAYMIVFCIVPASWGDELLSTDKKNMARVFSSALVSDKFSVGVYSPSEPSDVDYWCEGNHSADRREMMHRGYYPLFLRERLKGNPPKIVWHNVVITTSEKKPSRPLFVLPGAKMIFVLRRLQSGETAKDCLVFPTSSFENECNFFVPEDGYSGVGCLEWPETDRFGRANGKAPDWFVHLSSEELADWCRCREWIASARDASERPNPETPWGREVFKSLDYTAADNPGRLDSPVH